MFQQIIGYTLQLFHIILEDLLADLISVLKRFLDLQIDMRCELFGVDPIEGWKQFEIGYDVYHNTHGKSVTVEPRVVNPVIKADVKKYVNQPSTTVEPIVDHQVDTPKFRPADRSMDDLLITLMSAMQPADFVELVHKVDERSVDWSNVFDQVYGKIDVRTFVKLVRLKNG